jgi:hypothetical protein
VKAPDFAWLRAGCIDEAVDALVRYGEGAAVLAGGQSLMAMLDLRAGRALRRNVLAPEGALLHTSPQALDLRDGRIVDATSGAVQGIGGALYEELCFDAECHLQTGTLADYLAPMACEMPVMEVGHVQTPSRTSELDAKGAGEAGTAGVMGAVLNAVNDALRPSASS